MSLLNTEYSNIHYAYQTAQNEQIFTLFNIY